MGYGSRTNVDGAEGFDTLHIEGLGFGGVDFNTNQISLEGNQTLQFNNFEAISLAGRDFDILGSQNDDLVILSFQAFDEYYDWMINDYIKEDFTSWYDAPMLQISFDGGPGVDTIDFTLLVGRILNFRRISG